MEGSSHPHSFLSLSIAQLMCYSDQTHGKLSPLKTLV
uniref:Uncharacterized protein n=1 Tax=Arabidopsis thaliana TaxID=3702 RepID=Q56ZY6_ARATH|nr:hypothetical protein [Arabidopsis thaliana]